MKKSYFLVLISPQADPPSLLFYGNMMGIPPSTWLFDHPRRPLEFDVSDLPPPVMIVVRNENDLLQMKKRFNFESAKRIKSFGRQHLYLVEK